MREPRLLRRMLFAALPLCVPVITGCHSWRASTVPPGELLAGERPQTVRLTLGDGSVMTMSSPTVVADTIVGSTRSGTARVAAEDVRALEVERLSPTRTLALVVGHVSAVVSVVALIIAVQPHYSGF